MRGKKIYLGGEMTFFAGRAYRFVAFFAMIFTVIGCSSSKPKPANFHIYSEADSHLNLDFNERPLSVVLNVYQLKDRQTFARLTFEDFVSGKSDETLLGEDIVSKTELVVLPGNKQELNAKLAPEAQYLGVVAIYRMPANQQWRYLVPAEQIRKKSFWGFSKEKTVSIRLHGCYITVDGVEIDFIPGQKGGPPPTCTASPVGMNTGNIGEASAIEPSTTTSKPPTTTADRMRSASEATSSAATTATSISNTASAVSNGATAAKTLVKP